MQHKLEHYGDRGTVLDWFKNCLTNRKQLVNYACQVGCSNCYMWRAAGIGSWSLGTVGLCKLHFRKLTLIFLLFADDTNLFYSHRNPEILNQIANQKMCKVANWLRTNIFFLNISKTHFIVFKTENKEKPSNFEIKINKETFEQVNSTKFLGLIIEKSYPGNNILKKWKQKYQEC